MLGSFVRGYTKKEYHEKCTCKRKQLRSDIGYDPKLEKYVWGWWTYEWGLDATGAGLVQADAAIDAAANW